MKTKYSSESAGYFMLRHLFFSGITFRRDLYLAAVQYFSYTAVSLQYRSLLADGLLVQSEFARADIVSVTEKGIDFLGSRAPYYSEFGKIAGNGAVTANRSQLTHSLSYAHTYAMSAGAGAIVYPYLKPTLLDAYRILSFTAVDPNESPVYAQADYESLQRMLHTSGIFYSHDEVRAFLRDAGSVPADQTYGSRFTGLYLSDDKLIVYYTSVPGKYRMLKWRNEFEYKLIDALNHYFGPLLNYQKRFAVPGERYGSISACLITDGHGRVPEMVMGFKDGRAYGTDSPEKQREKRGAAFSNLDYSVTAYEQLFVTPADNAGIESLRWLLGSNPETYREEATAWFREKPGFESSPESAAMLYGYETGSDADWGVSAVYLPVYEVHWLDALSRESEKLAVVTTKEMADTISHCLRKDLDFFDMETGEKMDVKHYDRHGFVITDGVEAVHHSARRYKRKRVTVSISAEDKKRLQEEADQAGMSLHRYLSRKVRYK